MILNLARANYVVLLLVGIVGMYWIAPEDTSVLSTLLFAGALYGPLLLFSPAVITGNKRQMTWLCFLLLFYFCGFSVQLLDPPPVRTLAIAKTSLTVVLFVLAACQIRYAKHAD